MTTWLEHHIKCSTLWSWKRNYQSVAVVLVLGRPSVKHTLKRRMKVEVKVVEFLRITFFVSSPPLQLSGCLLLCSNGFPVWFGSGWGWAEGFIDNISLPAYEGESLSVLMVHVVVGSFSAAHDTFARPHKVNPWLRAITEDDFIVNFRLTSLRLLLHIKDVAENQLFKVDYMKPHRPTIPSTNPKKYCPHSVHLSLRLRTMRLIKSNPIPCVAFLPSPEIRQIYGPSQRKVLAKVPRWKYRALFARLEVRAFSVYVAEWIEFERLQCAAKSMLSFPEGNPT